MAIEVEQLRKIIGCEDDELQIPPRLQERLVRNEAYAAITGQKLREFLNGVIRNQSTHVYEVRGGKDASQSRLHAVIAPYTSLRQDPPKRGHGFQVRALITECNTAVASDLLVCNDFVIDTMRSTIAWKRAEVTRKTTEAGKVVWPTTPLDVPKVLQPERKPAEPVRLSVHTGVEYEQNLPFFSDAMKVTAAEAFKAYAERLTTGDELPNADFIFIPH